MLETKENTTKLSTEDLRFVSEFFYKKTGIQLGEEKRYLIESRLKTVLRIANLNTMDELCQELRKGFNVQVETLVIDALTTNETSWFRDGKPFVALEKTILKKMAELKATTRTLNIWSAASSTGQEIYTIAMIIQETGLFNGWNVKITGTDISQSALQQAKEGVYSQLEISRGMPVKLLIKYFDQVDDNTWRVKPVIKNMARFSAHNLKSDATYLGKFDMVFCRNVLIYFDLQSKQQILGHIRKVLHPSGLLCLGGSETTYGVDDYFQPIFIDNAAFYVSEEGKSLWIK